MAIKTVIDPNVLVASLSSNSKYYWLIELLLDKTIELYLNSDILLKYEEALKLKYSEATASNFLTALKMLPNVFHTPDPDYLISHDKHFTVPGPTLFPKVDVVRLDEFLIVFDINNSLILSIFSN